MTDDDAYEKEVVVRRLHVALGLLGEPGGGRARAAVEVGAKRPAQLFVHPLSNRPALWVSADQDLLRSSVLLEASEEDTKGAALTFRMKPRDIAW